MIKVDGHDCIHELLNNKSDSALDTIRVLRARLKHTDSVCVEITFMNLEVVKNGLLDELYTDYPNIKYALLYRTPKQYLDPNYGLNSGILSFNEWKENLDHPIKTQFVNLSNIMEAKTMTRETWQAAYNHIANLFWPINNNMPLYFEYNEHEPNIYHRFYQVLKKYNPDFTVEEYHDRISKNLKEYPQIIETVKNEINSWDFTDD